jgi:hypothetical protein
MWFSKLFKELLKERCLYAHRCPFYHPDNFTCGRFDAENGYCGRYKEFRRENA